MDLQELKQKMNKDLGALIRYDDKGNAFVSMPVGKIPLNQFKEFNSFVNSEHAGNRWLAIWTLYLRNKNFDLEAEAQAYREELEQPKEEPKESNPLGLLNGD